MADIEPEFRTPQEDWSGNEKAKLATKGLTVVIKDINSPANLAHQFRDTSFEDLPDVAEALAKSYGIYTDFNRAKTGVEKDWMYMFRIAIPSGGPITAGRSSGPNTSCQRSRSRCYSHKVRCGCCHGN